MSMRDKDKTERLDQAVSDRLARLRTMPVDTARLERMLSAQIPSVQPQRFLPRWLRPLRAVAASLIIILSVIGVLWMSSGGPVLASAAQMAQVHHDMVAGRVAVMKVDSIEEAGKLLATASSNSPDLPRPPDAHVMACCMRSIDNRKMACVLLRSEGTPITMSVANASDMQVPNTRGIERDGARYYVQTIDQLNMVVTERQGRWVCLIAELPADRLIDIAAKLQF